jgi:hypothetical protein
MKDKRNVWKLLIAVASLSAALVADAATFSTLQNSPLSLPAVSISSIGGLQATNLSGSNFMLSAITPNSSQGGHVSLLKSPQWSQRYHNGAYTVNVAYALVVRKDSSVVVTGWSPSNVGGTDFATICYASDGTPIWTNRYDGPGHGFDAARFVAANDSGDVWVTGDSLRYATNSTLTDVITIHYASNGVPVWTNRYSSFETNGADVTQLLVDNSGNAYVRQYSAYWQGNLGTPVESTIIKYDLSGNTVWTKHFLDAAPDTGQELLEPGPMTLDATGNLFVAGRNGYGNFPPGVSLIKYDGEGAPLWTNYFSEPFALQFQILLADQQQNIILTGQAGDNNNSYVVMKRSFNGTMLWTNIVPGPVYLGGNVPQASVDPAGDIFLIGGSPGQPVGFYQAIKFSPTGVPVWTNSNLFFGTNAMIGASGVDVAGNLYVTGETYTSVDDDYDLLTLKCSSASGQITWTDRLNGPGNAADIPFAMGLDPAGNVYVTGRSVGINADEFCTVKYSDNVFYSPPAGFTGLDTLFFTLTDNLGNSATGSVDVAVNPGSFHFDSSAVVGPGVQLHLNGFPGTNRVVLEASTNLLEWKPILTNAPVSGSVQFLDSTAANGVRRFYRAFQTQ